MSFSSWVRAGTLSCPDLCYDGRGPPRMASFVSSAPVVGWLQTTHRRHMGSFSMLRWSCRKRAPAGDCLGFGCISAGTFRSPSRGVRMCSSTAAPPPPPPWLMLQPASGGGDMIYRFYSVAEKKVLYYPKMTTGGAEWPDDDAKFVGSSHGWLALFNQHTNKNLFLSNPISGRHIKLPPIDALPHPEMNFKHGRGSISKLILSCSPEVEEEEAECRAMMIFGSGDRLAFCSPGRSTQWTPIGDLLYEERPRFRRARMYEDFVYCSRRKLFTCLTRFEIEVEEDSRDPTFPYPFELEDWDLRDPRSPRIDRVRFLNYGFEKTKSSWWLKENLELLEHCIQIPHLVYVEAELFVVMRFVTSEMPADGSYPDLACALQGYPYKTFGFCVLKADEEGELTLMEGSLDGLAMFVGINHSFAMSASLFPELKPNSIYFTDPKLLTPPDSNSKKIYGGHDIGIFDYENQTFSPCYYPCDLQSIKRIVPPPLWFTPSQ